MDKSNYELQISKKLSLLIRLTVASNSNFSKLKTAEVLEIVKDMEFESTEIASMFGIPVKTVRNVSASLKKNK